MTVDVRQNLASKDLLRTRCPRHRLRIGGLGSPEIRIISSKSDRCASLPGFKARLSLQRCISPYCLSYNSQNVSSENLVLDQLLISQLILSRHLLVLCFDTVRRNPVLNTHGSLRVKSRKTSSWANKCLLMRSLSASLLSKSLAINNKQTDK